MSKCVFSVFFWNVRGLGQSSKCDEIKRILTARSPTFVCLQELKLEQVSHFKKLSLLPPSLRSIVHLPSVGASEGIITAWAASDFDLLDHSLGVFSLTTRFQATASNLSLTITNVYGPCDSPSKPEFLHELSSIASSTSGPWAIVGDFNLIRYAEDKSNDTFNIREASLFNAFINDCGLLEIPLLDRLFTWSNNQANPTLVRLDRALVNIEWNNLLTDTSLSSFCRNESDHVPLSLRASANIPRPVIFRLNNSWLSAPTFPPLVSANWNNVQIGHPRVPLLLRSSVSGISVSEVRPVLGQKKNKIHFTC